MANDEKIQFTGHVSETGDISLPTRLKGDVAKLFAGRDIVVTFERKRRKRSLNQNAYYWSVIIQFITDAMNEAGENVAPQEVHEFLKFRFLRVQKIDPDTAELLWEYSRSTTGLSTVQFSLYMDQCIQFAAEMLGVTIPAPSTMQDLYTFPEYIGKSEKRTEYVGRIAGYVQGITDKSELKKYFLQNPEWNQDVEIRTIFNERWIELRTGQRIEAAIEAR